MVDVSQEAGAFKDKEAVPRDGLQVIFQYVLWHGLILTWCKERPCEPCHCFLSLNGRITMGVLAPVG